MPLGVLSVRACRRDCFIDFGVVRGEMWRRIVVLWCFRRIVQGFAVLGFVGGILVWNSRASG